MVLNSKSHHSSTCALKDKPKKILAIKLGAVGDLVLASPFFDNLKSNFQEAEIVLLTGRTCYPTIKNNPCIDRFLIADDSAIYGGGWMARLKEALRLIYLLRKENFDVVFIMHRAWQFSLLAFLTGIGIRVGFDCQRQGALLTYKVKPVPFRNEREVYLDFLRVLGVPGIYKRTYYYLSPTEEAFRDQFLKQHGITGEDSVIAVAPGGGDNVKNTMPSRRWPEENFKTLVRKTIEETSFRIILVGGPSDREAVSTIKDSNPECVDATHLSFGEMASLFRQCSLFIGNDSGPLHIASAVGISTISLYGPTSPQQWASPDPQNTVLFKNAECSPCYNNGQFPDCDHITCLKSIEVDEVWDTMCQKLPFLQNCKSS
jgi:lipopolysaccharide heptosyltransferase II